MYSSWVICITYFILLISIDMHQSSSIIDVIFVSKISIFYGTYRATVSHNRLICHPEKTKHTHIKIYAQCFTYFVCYFALPRFINRNIKFFIHTLFHSKCNVVNVLISLWFVSKFFFFNSINAWQDILIGAISFM